MTLYYPMPIKQGVHWQLAFPVINPLTGGLITVNGWTAKSQIRKTATDATILHEWSTANTNIVVAGTTVTLKLTPLMSSPWTWTRGVYDIQLTDPNGVETCLAEGPVLVDPSVTR